jgi:hypothetical protein
VPLYKSGLPLFVGPDRDTVLHTTNTLKSFSGSSIIRPEYLRNLNIVGTRSLASDVTSTTAGFESLNDAIEYSGKELWLTMGGQQWER